MRALRSLRFSWLDFKVGFRMLVRYPGLTLVGTAAIAVAIALGTLYFEALEKWQNPRLPIRDADRIISIRAWDDSAFAPEPRALHDFAIWHEQVKTLDHLGAAITFERNLATEDGLVQPVRGAEISPSAFRMLGAAARLGRTLTAQDENPADPPVVVISHSLWKTRFGSDPRVVGRVVKLGTVTATIVGVMPEGFGFPVNERIWTPLADLHGLPTRSQKGIRVRHCARTDRHLRRAQVRPCRSSAVWHLTRRSTRHGRS